MMYFFIILIILSLLALFVLNRFYELEPWFKRVIMGILLVGIIGTLVSFFLNNKDNKPKKAEIEQISSDEAEAEALAVAKPITANNEYLKKAEALDQRIKQLLEQNIPNKRNDLKNQRLARYTRDSLLITIETAEQLLKSRQRFSSNDRIAYIEGNKNATDFSSAINRYKNDLDSLEENFNLNQ